MARANDRQANVWRSRIVGYRDVPPDQLLANPKNWRIHPREQQDALAGVIAEVGYVDPVKVQQGTDVVIDGHLRVSLALRDGVATIPVADLDVTDAEADLLLATFDPISALAATDAANLRALLDEVATGDAAVTAMIADLAENAGIVPADWSDAMGDLPSGDKSPFEQMTFTLNARQADAVRAALMQARDDGPFVGTGNENGNGNALARVCEAYVDA